MSISAVPFVRLTALAGIAIILVGVVVVGVADREQSRRAASATQSAVRLGGLVYQAPEARPLDPANPVDRGILRGETAISRRLPASQEWFGVFLTVDNPGRRPRPAARRFELVDLDGHRFRPEPGAGGGPYAYRPGDVAPGRVYPPASSVAAENLTAQGALLLFRIPRASLDFGSVAVRISDPTSHGASADLPVG